MKAVAAIVLFSEHVTEEQARTYLELLKAGGMVRTTAIKTITTEQLVREQVHFNIDL